MHRVFVIVHEGPIVIYLYYYSIANLAQPLAKDDTMAFFSKHPHDVMEVISQSAKELVRVLRKHPNSALPLLKEKMKLADIAALQACLKNTAQHVFILQARAVYEFKSAYLFNLLSNSILVTSIACERRIHAWPHTIFLENFKRHVRFTYTHAFTIT